MNKKVRALKENFLIPISIYITVLGTQQNIYNGFKLWKVFLMNFKGMLFY